jgi:hypothetical protein
MYVLEQEESVCIIHLVVPGGPIDGDVARIQQDKVDDGVLEERVFSPVVQPSPVRHSGGQHGGLTKKNPSGGTARLKPYIVFFF